MANAKGGRTLGRDTKAFTLGVTLNVRGSKNFDEVLPSGKAANRRIVPTHVDQKLGMELWNLLKQEGAALNFDFSSAQVNLNFPGKPHRDKNDTNFQWCCSLGEFTGGRLCWQEGETNFAKSTKGVWQKMDGRKHLHWVEDYIGKRFSIILFDNISYLAKPIFYNPTMAM